MLKESNKSTFDSYSVRNSILIISHITFRDCRAHIFSDNLSQNSCNIKHLSPTQDNYKWSSILGDPGAVSRVGRKGATKVFMYGRRSPWVPTLTELFPKLQADAGSWLGTKNALYYCAQSANSFSWVLFVSSYTTAIVSIAGCPHQNTVCPKDKDAFPKIQAWAYNRYSRMHRSRLAYIFGNF